MSLFDLDDRGVIAHDIGRVRDVLQLADSDGTISVHRSVRAAVDALVSPGSGDPEQEG